MMSYYALARAESERIAAIHKKIYTMAQTQGGVGYSDGVYPFHHGVVKGSPYSLVCSSKGDFVKVSWQTSDGQMGNLNIFCILNRDTTDLNDPTVFIPKGNMQGLFYQHPTHSNVVYGVTPIPRKILDYLIKNGSSMTSIPERVYTPPIPDGIEGVLDVLEADTTNHDTFHLAAELAKKGGNKWSSREGTFRGKALGKVYTVTIHPEESSITVKGPDLSLKVFDHPHFMMWGGEFPEHVLEVLRKLNEN